MKIFLVLSQYNIVYREIGISGWKHFNTIHYGSGWPGVFGYRDEWWQRLANIRARFGCKL